MSSPSESGASGTRTSRMHRRSRAVQWLLTVASAPLIYSLFIPLALLDLWMTVYQSICFPVYRLPRVERSRHVVLDRARLPYLTPLEKLNCVYCGYANGVLSYAREIAGRTELYWCPIKHAVEPSGLPPRYRDYFPYGDAESYRRWLAESAKQSAEGSGDEHRGTLEGSGAQGSEGLVRLP